MTGGRVVGPPNRPDIEKKPAIKSSGDAWRKARQNPELGEIVRVAPVREGG